jgi:short-chain fatty acids transporter
MTRFDTSFSKRKETEAAAATAPLARAGAVLSDWSERWFPDAFAFALLATIIVFGLGLAAGSSAGDLAGYFGESFWSLAPFTIQMAMIVIGGYVVAKSKPVHNLICRLASVPATPRGAVALVALVATSTSLISYGFSLVFSGFLAREIAGRLKGVDYRALGAAAYLGLGSIWALGLSSSAALLMATPALQPASLFKVSGLISLGQTIYTWQSMLTAVILMSLSVTIAFFSTPTGSAARTVESFGIMPESPLVAGEKRRKPGDWLENSPAVTVLICLIGFGYIGETIHAKGALAALNLNTYNLLFLMMGLLLHWRPRSFTRAALEAVPATGGILIQFPFYAGIFGMISFSPISKLMADFFVRSSNHNTYPILVAIYSATLGLFVPSGGSKWLIEAPYVMGAATAMKVHLGWIVQVYNAAEALPNLVNPFWMLPLLGILKIKARDIIGFGLLQLVILGPVVLFLMWFLARTFTYVPPVIPA